MPAGAVICIPCGIHARTGRSIATAEQRDTNSMYGKAHGIIWFASWLSPLGLYPIASEAHGSRKPLAIPAIAILTIMLTAWMWGYEWSGSSQMRGLKNLFLWAGDRAPDAERIYAFYELTNFGDQRAWEWKLRQLSFSVPEDELAQAALSALPSAQRCFGEFHFWQLLTHTFFHADALHLAGNMLFLLIFGTRINAAIGNVGIIALYPVLAAAAAWAQMLDMRDEMPSLLLGASGAIMGLAGMYLVLFPVTHLHVAAWIRIPFLKLKMFKCRSFWILLLFIAFDVIYTVLAVETGTAHWAHLGGFIAGVLIALALVLSRGINTRGSDLLSVTLGRHAWHIMGKPSQWAQRGQDEGWLTHARIIPDELWDRGWKAAFGKSNPRAANQRAAIHKEARQF